MYRSLRKLVLVVFLSLSVVWAMWPDAGWPLEVLFGLTFVVVLGFTFYGWLERGPR